MATLFVSSDKVSSNQTIFSPCYANNGNTAQSAHTNNAEFSTDRFTLSLNYKVPTPQIKLGDCVEPRNPVNTAIFKCAYLCESDNKQALS